MGTIGRRIALRAGVLGAWAVLTGGRAAALETAQATAQASPQATAQASPGIHHIDLPGATLFPEGVAVHHGTGDVFVGGLANGEVLRIRGGVPAVFKQPHEDGLKNTIGLAVDPLRNRLWVASTAFIVAGAMNQNPSDVPEVLVFDTESAELLGRFAAPTDGAFHFFNDIDLDSSGNAFITDTFAPVVWRVNAALDELTPLANDPALAPQQPGFNLNGIVVTPDDRFVIAAIAGPPGVGAFFRVDRETGTVIKVEIANEHGGGDGLVFVAPTRMLAISNGVVIVDFDDDFERASITPSRTLEGAFDLPTTADLLGDSVVVVNSQLDHFVPMFENDTDPELPFQLVVIPLRAVFPEDPAVRDARDWLAMGSPVRAVEALRGFLEREPEDLSALRLMALARHFQGGEQAALPWLRKTASAPLAEAEDHLRLARALGLAARSSGLRDGAELAAEAGSAARRATALAPGNAEAELALIDFLIQAPPRIGGSSDEALRRIEALVTTHPWTATLARGRIHQLRREWHDAELPLRAALEMRPDSSLTYYELGHVLERQGRPEEAFALYEALVELEPDEWGGLLAIGRISVRFSINQERGHEALTRVLRFRPNEDGPDHREVRSLLKQLEGGDS